VSSGASLDSQPSKARPHQQLVAAKVGSAGRHALVAKSAEFGAERHGSLGGQGERKERAQEPRAAARYSSEVRRNSLSSSDNFSRKLRAT
jgi:hypothetical protein